MKKIINGKLYDTRTAKLVGDYSRRYGDFSDYDEELYKKRTGEFFLFGEGGPMSAYAKPEGMNSWSGGSDIRPLTYEEAREWAEKKLDADDYAEIFGEPSEGDDADSDKRQLTLYLPESMVAKVKRIAGREGVSMSAWIEAAIAAKLSS